LLISILQGSFWRGVGEAAGGERQIRQAAERGGDSGAESAEDCGESLEEGVEKFEFGAAVGGRNFRQ